VTDPLDGISIFVAVAEAGSISEAARRLGLSKSAVSEGITRFESRLGARLLTRSSRGLSLTEPGRAVLEHGRRIVAEARAAELAAAALHKRPSGVLRLSVPEGLGSARIAPLLPGFLARFPDLAVDLSIDNRPIDLLAANVDLAIRIARDLASPTLVVRKLAPTRIVLCASPDYLARRGVPRAPEDIGQHDCLRFTALPWSDAWPFIGPAGQTTIPIASRLSSDSETALKLATLAGAGLSLFPAHQVEAELRAGTLVPVLTDRVPQVHAIYAVYPSNRLIAAKVRAFVELLARDLKREIPVRLAERRVRRAALPRRAARP
jgi:molybdate transport repressor ModE-like protein